jgi:hypothetical protein
VREIIKSKRWSYLAGLFDGDGSVSLTEHLSPRQYHYFLFVSVASTDRSAMNWLVQQFGGQYERHKEARPNMRDTYQWVTKGHHSRHVLEGMLPFLKLKKQVAKKALEYLNSIPPGEENRELRSKFAAEIRQLNRFFIPAAPRSLKPLLEHPSQLSKNDLAYIAGLMDAEGTFSLPTPEATSPQIQISNTDARILDWTYLTLGGLVFSSKKNNDVHRDAGLWRLSGGRCQESGHVEKVRKIKELFLLSIIPYLVIKKPHAIVSLSCLRGDKPSADCYNALKALNELGTPTTNTQNAETFSVKIESELTGDRESAPAVTQVA